MQTQGCRTWRLSTLPAKSRSKYNQWIEPRLRYQLKIMKWRILWSVAPRLFSQEMSRCKPLYKTSRYVK